MNIAPIVLDKLNDWQTDAETIRSDICDMLASRKIATCYGALLEANGADEGLIYDWAFDNYKAAILMGIRRQLDTDPDAISLSRLIQEIQESPHILTREFHEGLYGSLPLEIRGATAGSTFTEAGGNGSHIDEAILKDDEQMLKELGERIKKYANRRLAHRSEKEAPHVNRNEVDACLDALWNVARRYVLLLNADDVQEPEIQEDLQRVVISGNHLWSAAQFTVRRKPSNSWQAPRISSTKS